MTTPEDSYDKLFDELLRESARAAADFDANESSYQEDSQQELVDRHALRRVKGFSTELQDISDAEYRQLQLERVVAEQCRAMQNHAELGRVKQS